MIIERLRSARARADAIQRSDALHVLVTLTVVDAGIQIETLRDDNGGWNYREDLVTWCDIASRVDDPLLATLAAIEKALAPQVPA